MTRRQYDDPILYIQQGATLIVQPIKFSYMWPQRLRIWVAIYDSVKDAENATKLRRDYHTTVGVGGQKISCASFRKKYSVLQKFLIHIISKHKLYN